ncbi:SusC/RagA family TonB-linked outer membrane protein [Chitinophaga sp. Cy-1792]|uniref:SusC/RagA family TonB-linked outer membrane protein n=1 Tax=Chitinophaga sp. Cy-1792 TaxID=2608339 RepID=UPI0014211F9F|nr:SusC/RagA family TonB-linked outer membrane protein [Chitinophaga sp. Cy-1792]
MKLTSVLLLAALLQVSARARGQLVTLKMEDVPVKAVFKAIRQQTGLNILVFDAAKLDKMKHVSVNVTSMDVRQVLQLTLNETDLQFQVGEESVIIKPKPAPVSSFITTPIDTVLHISGQVLNEVGQPIPGVSVRLKSNNTGVAADEQGQFRINVPPGSTLVFTSLGFFTQEKRITDAKPIQIRLQSSSQGLKDVVVTGMVKRDAKIFSGATATYSGEMLRTVSNTNVIQSLRSLDPSFLLMENNLAGSNPNVLPTIELRGQSSISTDALRDRFSTDPNQPLFILNGFETDLRTVMDLDINRIASMTILKDAASTAMYGSRASNGVVVIETIVPKPGKAIFSYTNDLTVELPDLSSYNRMNAAEKLEFERLSGVYTPDSRFGTKEDLYAYYNGLYSSRLQEVQRGVNSYWLSSPLQTGISERHSVYASAGSNALLFDVGANYRKIKGTMIGSTKEDYGARLNLIYRPGKFNISNNLYVNGVKGNESPYGSFSSWVNVNPYYRKMPANVEFLAVLPARQGGDSIYIPNPLYNASLNSFDYTKSFAVTNNLQATYDISNSLRWTTNLQLMRNNSIAEKFVSPLNSAFDKMAFEKKGTLDYSRTDGTSYTANTMLTYFKVWGKSSLTANGRAEIQENNNQATSMSMQGFPTASNGNIQFAFGYKDDGRPAAYKSISRRNALLASMNYSYDRRYNLDATFRYDGSTSFGVNNPYSPYYSVGASWNLDQEAFLKHIKWINLLRVRGNVGVTGNQNFSSFTSVSTYSYLPSYTVFGQGVFISSKGNPDLKWQNTLQPSIGLDAAFMENRMTFQLNWYEKITDPMVIAVSLPSSSGLSNYPFNAGGMTVKGAEFTVRYSPIFHPDKNIVWTLGAMGSFYKQTYHGLGESLHGVNETLRNLNSMTRYMDGHSPDDLWAVPSAGIDPNTGREIFIKKDGTHTMDYDYADQVVVGNARPKVQGVISSSLLLKGFTVNMNFRYIVDQDIFNSALYNNVENISYNSIVNNNQDRRALYDRWKKAGDYAQFKSISITSTTPMSSRFVQRENTITLESFNVAYDFRNKPWLTKLHMSNLRLSGYMNDVFRLSTIKRERGIDYPFSRSFSFSLSTNFQ